MLYVATSKVSLKGARIVTLVCECVAAGVPKHVRMRLEAKPCFSPRHSQLAVRSLTRRSAGLRRERSSIFILRFPLGHPLPSSSLIVAFRASLLFAVPMLDQPRPRTPASCNGPLKPVAKVVALNDRGG
jgi:hypothetical protein